MEEEVGLDSCQMGSEWTLDNATTTLQNKYLGIAWKQKWVSPSENILWIYDNDDPESTAGIPKHVELNKDLESIKLLSAYFSKLYALSTSNPIFKI